MVGMGMKKLSCGNCDNSKLVPYNPDEDVCKNCGKVHEKLSDYRITEIEEFEVKVAKGDEKPFNLNDHLLTDKEMGFDFETQLKIMEGEGEV